MKISISIPWLNVMFFFTILSTNTFQVSANSNIIVHLVSNKMDDHDLPRSYSLHSSDTDIVTSNWQVALEVLFALVSNDLDDTFSVLLFQIVIMNLRFHLWAVLRKLLRRNQNTGVKSCGGIGFVSKHSQF